MSSFLSFRTGGPVVPPPNYGAPPHADHHTTKLIQPGGGCVVTYVPFTRVATSAVGTFALTMLVSACGSGTMPRTHSAAPSAHRAAPRVRISNYAYQPVKLTVARGTKVTFTNHDQTAHTATSTKTGFDSGTINPGQSATIIVSKPGTYTYSCQFHAFMHGTITVR